MYLLRITLILEDLWDLFALHIRCFFDEDIYFNKAICDLYISWQTVSFSAVQAPNVGVTAAMLVL